MKNWIKLSDKDYREVWDKVYKEFEFEPSTSTFPSFKVATPFVTYDISQYVDLQHEFDIYDDLEEKALTTFKKITAHDEYIYALDWQHESYLMNPNLEFHKDEFDEWLIPIFPNGDYYFFTQKDFRWGYLGHPWERTITVFGQEIIDVFEKSKPRMFDRILRQG
jgi:hypothetical protein